MRLDAIGDFVIWTSCAQAYRLLYPKDKFHLVLLGHVVWQEVAKELRIFDEVLAIDRKRYMLNFEYRLAATEIIHKYQYDTAIYHTYSREFASGDLIIRQLNATNKIGIKTDYAIDSSFWSNISSKWYTKILEPTMQGIHELNKNAAFIHCLGITDFAVSLPFLNIKNCPCDEIDLPATYFVLFPGARVGLRKWNEQNYAELAQRISETTHWQGIICGGSDEKELADTIIRLSGLPLVNLCGASSLLQLIGVIKNAKFLVGNETSGVHIASAVQTPSICILGGGHFGRFVPYPEEINSPFKPLAVFEQMECFGCNWNCIYQIGKETTVPCIKNITVDKVWRKIQGKITEIS